MDRERIVSLAVAVLCMLAIGVSATTLETTVSQTPDDMIDFNDRTLPLGDESTSDIDRQIERNKDSRGEEESGSPDSGSGGAGSAGRAGDGSGAPSSNDADDASQSSDPSQSGLERLGGDGPIPTAAQAGQRTFWNILPYLLALLLLALAYRYRERLRALLLAPLALLGSGGHHGRDGRDRDPWEGAEPDDEVERAWFAMVRQTDLERPWAKTPSECREAAIEAGLDPDAVGVLTRTYREKRYRGTGPTDTHRARARECLDQLNVGRRLP